MADDLLFDVVRGIPTDEEVAAVVAALLAARATRAARPPAAPSAWARSARPGAAERRSWRACTLPR